MVYNRVIINNNPIFYEDNMNEFIDLMSNPYAIGVSIYIIMLLFQVLITISSMRSNFEFLVSYHEFTKKELRMMFIMSIVLTPISTFIWVKSLFNKKPKMEI
jgi:hypothetical protein